MFGLWSVFKMLLPDVHMNLAAHDGVFVRLWLVGHDAGTEDGLGGADAVDVADVQVVHRFSEEGNRVTLLGGRVGHTVHSDHDRRDDRRVRTSGTLCVAKD